MIWLFLDLPFDQLNRLTSYLKCSPLHRSNNWRLIADLRVKALGSNDFGFSLQELWEYIRKTSTDCRRLQVPGPTHLTDCLKLGLEMTLGRKDGSIDSEAFLSIWEIARIQSSSMAAVRSLIAKRKVASFRPVMRLDRVVPLESYLGYLECQRLQQKATA